MRSCNFLFRLFRPPRDELIFCIDRFWSLSGNCPRILGHLSTQDPLVLPETLCLFLIHCGCWWWYALPVHDTLCLLPIHCACSHYGWLALHCTCCSYKLNFDPDPALYLFVQIPLVKVDLMVDRAMGLIWCSSRLKVYWIKPKGSSLPSQFHDYCWGAAKIIVLFVTLKNVSYNKLSLLQFFFCDLLPLE